MPYEYRVSEGQSLLDVCLQCYGNIDQIYRLVEDNIDVLPNGLETDLVGGAILTIDEQHIVDEYLVTQFQLNNKIIATEN